MALSGITPAEKCGIKIECEKKTNGKRSPKRDKGGEKLWQKRIIVDALEFAKTVAVTLIGIAKLNCRC